MNARHLAIITRIFRGEWWSLAGYATGVAVARLAHADALGAGVALILAGLFIRRAETVNDRTRRALARLDRARGNR